VAVGQALDLTYLAAKFGPGIAPCFPARSPIRQFAGLSELHGIVVFSLVGSRTAPVEAHEPLEATGLVLIV